MAKPFSGFEANDGTRYVTEFEAVCRDAQVDITKSFPELKALVNSNRMTELALLLRDYANMAFDLRCDAPEKDPPENDPPAEPWPEAVRDAMSSDNLGEPISFERCEHDWQKTENWLIDKCATCGEERA